MRLAWVMAVMAALWVQPAQAVQFVTLTGPYATTNHQKITVTGLTGSDAISVTGFFGPYLMYWWSNSGGTWFVDGNDYLTPDCTVSGGTCHAGVSQTAPAYPALNLSLTGLLDINVVGNEIFVDWSKFASGNACPGIAEADRIGGIANKCGFNWESPDIAIRLSVAGPSAESFGYTVEKYVPTPVPEPSTWALMMLGVGLAGGGIRRRQANSAKFPWRASPA